VVCAVIAPISIMLLWTLVIPPLGSYQRRRWRKGEITWSEKLWDANLSLLGIGLAIASTITVTNSFKNLVGRPRPDFLDRCQPLLTAINPSVFSLSTSAVCTRTEFLKDGYRSFPSGHSSISFAGLGFLTLFIAGRLNVLDTRGQVWKTVISLCPLVAAGIIAISRLMDNRHHPFDVIFGSTLGLLFAWMAYRQYFPPLARAEGGRPYSLAEFATEKGEEGRPAYPAAQPYVSPATYTDQPDLELGNRPRQRRKDSPGADDWDEAERTSTVPLRDDGYKPGPSFDEPTEYRRQI
jgi:diacylglycerol diphosphate phosphatase/phosphatidate phosphatase